MYGVAPISWSSKKQSIVALSTCEVEYVAATMSACQAVRLDTLLQELKINESDGVKLFVDNKSAINLPKNPTSHGRRKHIETRFHYLRDQVNKEKPEVEYCSTFDQLVDILTKPLKGERFKMLRDRFDCTLNITE